MKDTVTLKELIAIAVRRGQLAVILALAFAALMGGWRSYTLFKAANSEDNRPEEIEKRYQETLETYRETEASLKEQLIRAEIKLASQQEYNDKSFLMKIDSNNKAITTINLAITDVDEGAFQQVFRLEDTPIDFIISKIQSQYIILWNSLDLQSTLTYTPKGAIEDKYLREIVTLSQVDGGCLTLTVFGISEQESSKLADAAYNCLIELQSTISKGSYLHGFTLLSNVTKTCVDDSLESIQTANFEKIVTYTDSITSLNKQLDSLVEPERDSSLSASKIILSTVKYAVLGAVIGVVVTLVWALVSYLFRNRTETSRHLEQGLAIPFLGSTAKPGNIWNRLADQIIGERIWTDSNQALQYIANNAKVLLPPSGTVLLPSTLPLEEPAIQSVAKALSSQGRTIRFVDSVNRNPETAEALNTCGCVVLVERAGVSRWDDLIELAALLKSLDRPLRGFVMI